MRGDNRDGAGKLIDIVVTRSKQKRKSDDLHMVLPTRLYVRVERLGRDLNKAYYKSYVIDCRTAEAVRVVRKRLSEALESLDGMRVEEIEGFE